MNLGNVDVTGFRRQKLDPLIHTTGDETDGGAGDWGGQSRIGLGEDPSNAIAQPVPDEGSNGHVPTGLPGNDNPANTGNPHA